MSFKREGDDKSQLNILKKRRVADLLSHFIPEDEAALMKNGRYTCLVCSYRPVFDTVDTLTVHRKGKRHLEGLKKFYGKKTQLKNEITKRQHESYVQAEDSRQESSGSAPLLAQTRKLTHHALLKTVPYNSCHRKNSIAKPDQEKKDLKTPVSHCVPPDTAHDFTAAKTESNTSANIEEPQSAVTKEAEPVTAHRRKELEHYLKLKSDGWLQDRSGQWIKDENVEFDSDDEEPPSLNPQPLNHCEN